MDTDFRIGLKVKFNVSDRATTFKLKSLSMGDHCIDQKNNEFNWCKGNGICNRLETGYKCNCTNGFMGTNCQSTNKCDKDKHDGYDFCLNIKPKSTGQCIQKEDDDDYSCECVNGYFWNPTPTNKGCAKNPQCIGKCNKDSEDCIEPDPTIDNTNFTCQCKENFINISNDNKTLNCVPINPCDEQHKKVLINDPKYQSKLCGKNAICVLNKENPEDIKCFCPKGYIGAADGNGCDPLLCSISTLNNCKQICIDDDSKKEKYQCKCYESYDMVGNECKIKNGTKCKCKENSNPPVFCGIDENTCKCPKGFNAVDKDGKNNGCEHETDYFVPRSICPSGKLNFSDNKWECDCKDGFTLDSDNTCKRTNLCGPDGVQRKICNSKHALCIIADSDPPKARCECPFGETFDNADEKTQNCISNCEKDKRYELCANVNAECDPSIGYKNDSINNTNDFCKCLPGFVRELVSKNQLICKAAEKTIQFKISIKNTFILNQVKPQHSEPTTQFHKRFKRSVQQVVPDPQGLADDYKSMYEGNMNIKAKNQKQLDDQTFNNEFLKNIKKVLELTSYNKEATATNNRIAVENCEKKNDNYDCTVTVALLPKTPDTVNLTEELQKHCHGDAKSCFYPNYASAGKVEVYLVADKNSIVYSTYKPCSSTKPVCGQYTYCIGEDNSSLYSCKCVEEYFEKINSEHSPTEGTKTIEKEICRVKDLCTSNKCPSEQDHGHCVQSLPYTDANTKKWVAPYFCSCQQNFNLTADKKCTDVCTNFQCSKEHGKCVYEGINGAACVCDAGWGGDNCENEHKASLGGWIAGIVILAVLVVVVSGVAFFFARKSRNSVSGHNHAGHPMEDYTGSSYRVGQPGAGQARAQPGYQGRDNQSFHRD